MLTEAYLMIRDSVIALHHFRPGMASRLPFYTTSVRDGRQPKLRPQVESEQGANSYLTKFRAGHLLL